MQRRHFLAGLASTAMASTAAEHAVRAEQGAVVLELFTSQGCSSCPPADALLGELARRPGVIALAWHVDYWDRLGWHDPFASRFATERQRTYARALDEDVYTPALVIGGARMVVGSDRSRVEHAVASPPVLPVRIVMQPDAVEIGPLPAAPGRLTALFATFEGEHVTRVGGGENGGRALREYNIARTAQRLDGWDSRAGRLAVPAMPSGQGAVVLIQSADLRVIGAGVRWPGGTRAAA
jgi:hypothetical protein